MLAYVLEGFVFVLALVVQSVRSSDTDNKCHVVSQFIALVSSFVTAFHILYHLGTLCSLHTPAIKF